MIKWQEYVDWGILGGPKIDKLAKEGNPVYDLPKANLNNLDFSFSGLKTAIINLNHKNPDLNKADLCASFEKTAMEMLLENVQKAIIELKKEGKHIDKVVLAGGVSANSYIREEFSKLDGIEVYYPELKLCTDNAAMIASAGYYNYLDGKTADYKLNAVPNLKL